MKTLILTLAFAILTVTTYGKTVKATKNLQLEASKIEKVDVDCGAGSLTIVGIKNLRNIEVKAVIHSTEDVEDSYHKYIDLKIERRGKSAIIKSTTKNSKKIMKIFGKDNVVKKVDLEIKLPTDLTLIVDDGSGSMKISNIRGNLNIDDGSGNIEIENIKGSVKIDDGSGNATITSVTGDVEVEDGSGKLSIISVEGNVVVDDGSGSITVRKVGKNVTIVDGGSGSISIKEVKGKVIRKD